MQRMKRYLSLLLVFALVLSPLAGSIRAYAEGEEIGEPETQVVEPQVEETDSVSETQAEKPEKEPEETPEAESTTPLGDEEQEQSETLELGEEKVGAPVRGGADFETLKQQVTEATDGDVIQVAPGEYRFTDKLMIQGKNIELKVEGGTATFYRDSSYSSTMIEIAEGAGLTLNDGIVMDGKNRTREITTGALIQNLGGFVHNYGTLIIKGGIYQNDKSRGGAVAAPFYSYGAKSRVELHDGTIQNNDYGYEYNETRADFAAGAFSLNHGTQMVMTGGTIQGNTGSSFAWDGLHYSESPGAGAIVVSPGSSFIMEDGTISENNGYGGGVLVGSGSEQYYGDNREVESEEKIEPSELATATFLGGTIENNVGWEGGGIYGVGNIKVDIPSNSTITIRKNKAAMGGGIAISDRATGTQLETLQNLMDQSKRIKPKVSFDIWEKYFAGEFNMAGGTVEENYAKRAGGGIVISTNKASIVGGVIKNNTAKDQGGGIYVTTAPYTLHMQNVYIGGNSANEEWPKNQVLLDKTGGGVWFCPTGTAVFHAENGAFIDRDNTSGREAAGFFSFKKETGSDYTVTLAPRALSGGKIDYRTDSEKVRNKQEESQIISVIGSHAEELALKTELDPDFNTAIVQKLSTVFVIENKSAKGGGIGSNGNIVFGTDNTISLTVKKEWAEGTESKPVEIEIRARLGEDDWLIQKVQLNAENQFTYTLEGLPETVGGEALEGLLYVKELNNDAFTTEISKITKKTDEQTDGEKPTNEKAFIVTVKNTKKPSTPGTVDTMVKVQKIWEDENNRENKRPTSITVRLYANGRATDKTLILNAENGWRGFFTGLDKYSAGEKIRYTVQEETSLSDYESVVSGTMEGGFTITNSRKPEKPPVPEKPPIPEKPRVPAIPVYPRVPIIPKAGIGA